MFADKQRSLNRCSSLADSGHGVLNATQKTPQKKHLKNLAPLYRGRQITYSKSMNTWVVMSCNSVAFQHFRGKFASILRVREWCKQETVPALLLDWIILKMKTICSSEAWADLYRTAQCNSNTIVWNKNLKTRKAVGVLCFTAPSVMEVPTRLPWLPCLECKLLLRYKYSCLFYLPFCWLCLYHGKVFLHF
jgi:hypothetical protein